MHGAVWRGVARHCSSCPLPVSPLSRADADARLVPAVQDQLVADGGEREALSPGRGGSHDAVLGPRVLALNGKRRASDGDLLAGTKVGKGDMDGVLAGCRGRVDGLIDAIVQVSDMGDARVFPVSGYHTDVERVPATAALLSLIWDNEAVTVKT